MTAPRIVVRLLVALTLGAGLAACTEDPKPVVISNPVDDGPAPVSAFPCIHFEDLRRHLPGSIEGYRRVRDEGSTGRYGEVSISEAERVFSGDGGAEISIRIVDTTLVDDLGRAIRAAARDAADRAPDDPTAPIIGSGAIGFVRFDAARQQAEANLLVADRFVVAVSSRGVDGTQEVRRIADAVDINGLALLR